MKKVHFKQGIIKGSCGYEYNNVTHIYNAEQGVFEDVTESVNKENTIVIQQHNISETSITIDSDFYICINKYNRITQKGGNLPKHEPKYKVKLAIDYTINDIINDYKRDIDIIDRVAGELDYITFVKSNYNPEDDKIDVFNEAGCKVQRLLSCLNNRAIDLHISSGWQKKPYIPIEKDILNIYNILKENTNNFELTEVLYGVARTLIQYDTVLKEGVYESNIKNKFKLVYNSNYNDDDYIEKIKLLETVTPEDCKIDYKVYQKHLTVTYNDKMVDWLTNEANQRTKFITDIKNILYPKK